MPSNAERSEVAAKLRAMAVRANPSWPALMEALKCPGRSVAVQYLADLIDPTDETCELELAGAERAGCVCVYECSRCGKSCERVYGEDYEFCPYCGRRIENADE